MAARHPPQHEVQVHLLEPLAAALHHARVVAAIGEGLQRLRVLPDRHVDDDVLAHGLQRGRIARVVLQPPDETRRAVRDRVDAVERADEVGELRGVERRTQARDVHLGQLEP